MLDKAQDGWNLEATRPLHHKAGTQPGTVESGNHYVDISTDVDDRVWIGVHFGSRGFGHGIATWFLKHAGARDIMDVDPCVLDVNRDLGSQYLLAMQLAGAYAYARRDWVCDCVAKILRAEIVEVIHNHHYFVLHERMWRWDVVGCSQRGNAGISRRERICRRLDGEQSVILEGVENENAKYGLYSTVYGAGRAMGRREATGVYDRRSSECKRAGKVTQDMMRAWADRSGIELRGGG